MSDDIDTVITRLVAGWQPASLLLVDPDDGARGQRAARAAGCRPTQFTDPAHPEGLNELGRFDAALVLNTLERLERREGERLLARLRDLHTACFAVFVPPPGTEGEQAHDWERGALLAMGLRWDCRCIAPERELDVYVYDVRHYKRTPDWLNADNWANPQLWDRYRW